MTGCGPLDARVHTMCTPCAHHVHTMCTLLCTRALCLLLLVHRPSVRTNFNKLSLSHSFTLSLHSCSYRTLPHTASKRRTQLERQLLLLLLGLLGLLEHALSLHEQRCNGKNRHQNHNHCIGERGLRRGSGGKGRGGERDSSA